MREKMSKHLLQEKNKVTTQTKTNWYQSASCDACAYGRKYIHPGEILASLEITNLGNRNLIWTGVLVFQ